jgi:hypothetical protein
MQPSLPHDQKELELIDCSQEIDRLKHEQRDAPVAFDVLKTIRSFLRN